jgi:hypothetical protein
MYRAKLISWIFVVVVENVGSNPTIPTNFNLDRHGELSQSSLDYIQKTVDEQQRKSVSAIMSIISHRGYEDGKPGIGRKMYKLIEKELDRAKKRKADRERQHLEKFDHKCELCEIRLEMEDSPLLLEKGLLCQDCYRPIAASYWRADVLIEAAEYIEDYEKR